MATATVATRSARIGNLSHHVDSCAAIIDSVADDVAGESSACRQLYGVAELLRRLSADLDAEGFAMEKEEAKA